MKNLTTRQREVLQYIMLCKRGKGSLPTHRQIADHFGWKSANAARENIIALRKKGYLAPMKSTKARIELPTRIKP